MQGMLDADEHGFIMLLPLLTVSYHWPQSPFNLSLHKVAHICYTIAHFSCNADGVKHHDSDDLLLSYRCQLSVRESHHEFLNHRADSLAVDEQYQGFDACSEPPVAGRGAARRRPEQQGLLHRFGWLPLYPLVFIFTIIVKLKNRSLATVCGFQASALNGAGVQDVCAVDIVAERLQKARSANRDRGITFTRMDATNLAFADGTFDAAVVSCALHDMPTRTKYGVLAEMARVTRPGGNAGIFEPRTFASASLDSC